MEISDFLIENGIEFEMEISQKYFHVKFNLHGYDFQIELEDDDTLEIFKKRVNGAYKKKLEDQKEFLTLSLKALEKRIENFNKIFK